MGWCSNKRGYRKPQGLALPFSHSPNVRLAGLGCLCLRGIAVPSRGKKKIEFMCRTMRTALHRGAAGTRQPSVCRFVWLVQALRLIVAPRSAGAPGRRGMSRRRSVSVVPVFLKLPVLPLDVAFNPGQCVARHKHVWHEGRTSGPLRNVEMVFPPLRVNAFCWVNP